MPRDNFTIIERQIIRDTRLSRRARFLWIELSSHAEGWKTSVKHLAAAGTEGREAIRSSLVELERFGYLDRRQDRTLDGKHGAAVYELKLPALD